MSVYIHLPCRFLYGSFGISFDMPKVGCSKSYMFLPFNKVSRFLFTKRKKNTKHRLTIKSRVLD